MAETGNSGMLFCGYPPGWPDASICGNVSLYDKSMTLVYGCDVNGYQKICTIEYFFDTEISEIL